MICGMKEKDIKILAKMLNTPSVGHVETLKEYLENNPEVEREYHTSKRGIELVTIHFPNGKVRTYEVNHINTTTAFGK